MAIENSSNIGQCTVDCDRKFTIHLRRNINFDELSGVGFDWFRPEYEESITKIFEKDNILKPLFKLDIKNIKNTYKFKNIKSIAPFGTEYIPSILSMFSQNDPDCSNYIKKQQKKGLFLDVETYQVTGDDNLPLDGSSIICTFECDNTNIIIKPSRMNLSSLIDQGYAKDIVRAENIQKKRNKKFYRKEKAINIVIKDFITEHTEVKIFATFPSGKKEQVGQLVVCQNNINRYIKVQPVKIVCDKDYNIPKFENDLESFMAQSLVKVKFLKNEDLILNNKNNNEISLSFLNKYNDEKVDIVKKFNTKNEHFNYLINMREDIVGLYNKIKNINVDDSSHKVTFLIFIDLYSQAYSAEGEEEIKLNRKKEKKPINEMEKYGVQKIGGVATQINGNVWGNGTIVYKPIIQEYTKRSSTLLHEIGHSLGLDHIFEDNNLKFQFYAGYSDNIMDYGFTENRLDEIQDNPYSIQIGSLKKINSITNKFQWEIIQNDQSINY